MNRKLTRSEVADLREAAAAGALDRTLAERYAITESYVQAIRSGSRRVECPGPLTVHRLQRKTRRLQPRHVIQLREYVAAGHNLEQAARKFDVSTATARNLARGKTRVEDGGPITPAPPLRDPKKPSARATSAKPKAEKPKRGRPYVARKLTWEYCPDEEEWRGSEPGEVRVTVWKNRHGSWSFASTSRPSLTFKAEKLHQAKNEAEALHRIERKEEKREAMCSA